MKFIKIVHGNHTAIRKGIRVPYSAILFMIANYKELKEKFEVSEKINAKWY